LLFGLGVDLGVPVRCAEVGVPEPAPDHVNLDACLKEVDGAGYLYLIL